MKLAMGIVHCQSVHACSKGSEALTQIVHNQARVHSMCMQMSSCCLQSAFTCLGAQTHEMHVHFKG